MSMEDVSPVDYMIEAGDAVNVYCGGHDVYLDVMLLANTVTGAQYGTVTDDGKVVRIMFIPWHRTLLVEKVVNATDAG